MTEKPTTLNITMVHQSTEYSKHHYSSQHKKCQKLRQIKSPNTLTSSYVIPAML